MEAFAATTGGEEALPETFGVAFRFGIVLARFVHDGIRQAEHDPSEHSQHQSRIRRPYPAQVLLQGNVQAVVQSAFNDPVVAFEVEHSQSLQLLQRQTAQEKHYFSGPLAPAFDASFQPGR